jgi:hypothetical protein
LHYHDGGTVRVLVKFDANRIGKVVSRAAKSKLKGGKGVATGQHRSITATLVEMNGPAAAMFAAHARSNADRFQEMADAKAEREAALKANGQ